MAYAPYIEKETEIQETRANYHERLQPFNRSAPQPFPEETRDEYRRRALPILQNYAPGMQDVKVHDARGTAFDMIERQTFDAAKREAQRPTQIPEGELREIKRYDQAGRVSLEFYGKSSVWLSQFAPDRRRLVGIRTETERGYHPSNLSSNIVGTRY
jgi:hypothetical protein